MFYSQKITIKKPLNGGTYADDARMSGQTDAHDVAAAVEHRPGHRLNSRGSSATLHAQLVQDVLGKVDLVEREQRLGQVEARELDLMQIEELVDVFLQRSSWSKIHLQKNYHIRFQKSKRIKLRIQ